MTLDIDTVRRIIGVLASIGITVSSAELLAGVLRGAWAGMAAPRPASRPGATLRWWWASGIRLVTLLRLCSAVTFVVASALGYPAAVQAVAMTLCAATSLMLFAPVPVGVRLAFDGAEHLLTTIALVLSASYLLSTPIATKVALWFIACLALVDYAGSGLAKLRRWGGWRSGAYLVRVLTNPDYGYPRMATRAQAHPASAALMSRGVVILEIIAPLSIALPSPGSFAVLAGLLAFHVGTGLIMGLNTFVWAYLSTYPAIMYVNALIYP